MWKSESSSDRLYWSDAAKMLLVGLMKKHPDAIRDVRGKGRDLDRAKRDAWDLIFNDLLDYGMPSTTLDKVRYIWGKMKVQAVDLQKKLKRNKKTIELTKIQKAVIDLIENMNKECQHLMPAPINIKTEPMDEDDTNNVEILQTTTRSAKKSTSARPISNTRDDSDDEPNRKAAMHTNNNISPLEGANISNADPVIKGNLNPVVVPSLEGANILNADSVIKANLNPVVVLERIPMKHQFGGGQMINKESANYWNLMTEHEKERMAFERELHRKNVELMDLKVRIEKERLEAMLPRLFE